MSTNTATDEAGLRVQLYSDGSFYFGSVPTFGWVASCDGRRVISQGKGATFNDGSNNVAGEIAGALAALDWAVASGAREIVLHSDLKSLPKHFACGSSSAKARSRARRTLSRIAAEWTAAHAGVRLFFVFVRDQQCALLRRAHEISREVTRLPIAA